VIGLAGEQGFGFEFGDVGIGGVEFAVEFFQEIVFLLDVGFFLGEMDIGLDVAGRRGEFFVSGNLLFGALAISEDALCGFLIVPKRGIGDAGFEALQALAIQRCVKDSSVRA
jgi:hypothetical protein